MSKEFEEKVLEKLGELEEIKATVTKIDERVTKLDQRVTNLDEKVTKIDERVTKLDEKVTKMDERLENLENKFDSLNKSVLVIEDEISNKIPALFDGYSFNYELQKQTEKQLALLRKQCYENSIKICNLEELANKNSKIS